jgi:methyl-accepting chemotaxis protein
MAEKHTVSQSHNNAATATTVAPDFMKKAWEEQFARFTQIMDEAAKFQAKYVEQSNAAIDELARLSKESVRYATELSQQMQKVVLDGAKKSTEWTVK